MLGTATKAAPKSENPPGCALFTLQTELCHAVVPPPSSDQQPPLGVMINSTFLMPAPSAIQAGDQHCPRGQQHENVPELEAWALQSLTAGAQAAAGLNWSVMAWGH